MSSHVKIAKPLPSIPGTKPATRNAQLLVSTGIPSLDHFIGMFKFFSYFIDILINIYIFFLILQVVVCPLDQFF